MLDETILYASGETMTLVQRVLFIVHVFLLFLITYPLLFDMATLQLFAIYLFMLTLLPLTTCHA